MSDVRALNLQYREHGKLCEILMTAFEY